MARHAPTDRRQLRHPLVEAAGDHLLAPALNRCHLLAKQIGWQAVIPVERVTGWLL